MRSEQGRYNFGMQDDYPEHDNIQALTREISDITEHLTVEIKKRRQFEKTLSKCLEFDRLLLDLSAGFVNVPLNQSDKNIERTLKRIYEFFGGDFCALLEVLPDKAAWKITHYAAIDDISTISRETEFRSSICPWSFHKVIQKRKPFSFPRLDDLPTEAGVDKQTFLQWGIRSMLEVPIFIGDSIDRVIVVNSVRKECVWDEELVPKLQILGEIIAHVLKQKQSELDLGKTAERLDALINSTPDIIWSVDSERFGLTMFNRSLYEYFLNGIGLHIQVGMTPHDLLPTEEYAWKWCTFYQRALEEGSFATEYQVYAGGRTLRLNFNTLKRDDVVLGISVFGQDITESKGMENQIRKQLVEIETLRHQMEKENVYLRQEIKTGRGCGNIIGDSVALQYVLFRAQQVAPTDATVLILGETGTGKGMVAYAIHEMSLRKDKSIITVNCAALPENLIESELFGWEKGAFTGAHARQVGRFEVANGGTIFLDEIGEMPVRLQAKLLRVLQDGQFERLGSTRTIKVDVRVIAATSRDLKFEVQNGRFREDLFYRLNVFPVSIPPLRMRSEDVPQLVLHFIGKYARKCGKHIETVSKNTMRMLQDYEWPGNVRELEHIIERAIITSQGSVLELVDYLESKTEDKLEESLKDLEAVEREYILKVLQKTRWKIDGEGGAACILGLNPSTLRFRIKKLDITRP